MLQLGVPTRSTVIRLASVTGTFKMTMMIPMTLNHLKIDGWLVASQVLNRWGSAWLFSSTFIVHKKFIECNIGNNNVHVSVINPDIEGIEPRQSCGLMTIHP